MTLILTLILEKQLRVIHVRLSENLTKMCCLDHHHQPPPHHHNDGFKRQLPCLLHGKWPSSFLTHSFGSEKEQVHHLENDDDDDDGDFDDNYHGDGDLESGQRWSMSNM